MVNALDPDRMTADERLDEVADILAAGIRRLFNKNGHVDRCVTPENER